MKCTICEIANGNENSYIVFEDRNFIIFLDIRPLFLGHVLLAPKSHIASLDELPNDLQKDYFDLIQKASKAIETSMKAEGTFIAINNKVSQSIPHLHTHIVPRTKGDGLKGFFWPRMKYENEEQMENIQNKIRHHFLLLDDKS